MPWKSGSPAFYDNWRAMRQRCYNPNHKQYKDYGGRGIRVCERWLSFDNFIADMGLPPPGMQLDRIDNDGNYCPENCRWVTRMEQQRNRRDTRMVTIKGKTYIAAALSEISGLKTDTIIARAKTGRSLLDVLYGAKRMPEGHAAAAVAARVAASQSRTHCRKGHKFTEANTIWTKEGWRICRKCQQAKIARRSTTGYLSR